MKDIFFDLLRAALYGRPVAEADLPDKIDWPAVFKIAKRQAVVGLIIESLQFIPARLRPAGELASKLDAFALGLLRTHLVIDKTAARLATSLRQQGVDGVLLKGQGVARYYRVPQSRQPGDIDFYVGKRAHEKAIGICKAQLADADSRFDYGSKHFNFTMSGVHIELHRLAAIIATPVRRQRFQKWVEEELENPSRLRTLPIGKMEIKLPSYDFDALFVFYHAWSHFIRGGVGLRQLSDWTMILYNHIDDIDLDRLEKNLRRFGLTKGWRLFGWIAVNRLGLPVEKMPLYDPAVRPQAERIFEEVMAGGNFGFYSVANTRTPMYGTGLKHGLGKVRNITGYFLSLFPLIPAEATFLFFNRLYHGTIDHTRRNKKS